MWSRCALSVHWLTDTVAGALLGISVVLVSRLIFAPGSRQPLPATLSPLG
jgi:undecaprenyl-diphosphatase